MRILLTNDDGIDAPGMEALNAAVQESLGDRISEILVVAPDRCRSECSHSVTRGNELSVVEVREGWFAASGTPVDCVRIAMHAMSFKPDLVFSGVNDGANLGLNLIVSGTFAAAREAVIWRVPAMAISHYRRPDVPKTWEHVTRWSKQTIRDFAQAMLGDDSSSDESSILWNVNLPATDPTRNEVIREIVPVDSHPIQHFGNVQNGRVRFDMDYHNRARKEGTDVDRCFSGIMTISKVNGILPD